MDYRLCAVLEDIISRMKREPRSICVVDEDGTRTTSNSSFLSMVASIERLFVSKGFHSDDFIAIRLKRGMEHIAAMYACMAYGCPYLVVNPDYPEERARKILDGCRPSMIIDEGVIGNLKDEGYCDVAVNKVSDDSLGIVFYTSGTTGEPKGALHTRLIFVRNNHFCEKVPAESDDAFLSVTDYMFAFSLWDVILPMRYGITVHIGSTKMSRDIAMLKRYVAEHKITCSTLNPSVLRMVGPDSNLKTAIIAGEKPGIFNGFERMRILNDYGCSECGSIAVGMIADVHSEPALGDTYEGETLFLGEGTEDGKGEICLRCSGSMLRYIGKNDTCGKYSIEESAGMKVLHTGDYGLATDRGIVNLGRMDGMVKINGQRVEPSEVEFRINKIDGVENAVVKAFEDNGTHYLCCYYVGPISSEEIKDALSSSVTSYMIPAYFQKMDALPRNERGKVDRAGLKSLKPDFVAGKPPENEIQAKICDAFSTVFGIKGIGIDNDFVQLGGDSLKAMKIQSLIGDVSVSIIRKYRTPEAIAKHIGEDDHKLYMFKADNGCPLTGDQMTMYMDMVVNKKTSAYNLDFEFSLNASAEDARKAIDKVIQSHPILSTVIDDSTMPPRIMPGPDPEISVTDYVPAISTIKRPFDLNKGPIARFYISPRETGCEVYASVNHLMFDGMSMAVFEKETLKALSGIDITVETDYLKISSRENMMRGSDEWDASKFYLDERFADYDGDSIPPQTSNGKIGTEFRRLKTDKDELSEFASKNHLSTYNVMLSAFAYTLSRYIGNEDVFFCTVENGRDFGDFSRSFGMFAKTVPHRIDCKDASTMDFLYRVSSDYDETMSKNIYPFSSFASEHGLRSDIVFQYRADIVPVPPQLNADGTIAERPNTNDMLASIYDSEGGYLLGIDHSDKYSTAFIDGFGKTLDMVLSGLMRCNELSDIQLADEDDIEVMDAFNSESGCKQHPDIVDAYRSSANRSPTKTFVRSEDDSCTFKESLSLTGGIASKLKSESIGRNDIVCMFVPRSIWTVIVPLSILRSGAAFLALDPSFPDSRIASIIEDSKPKAIVTIKDLEDRISRLFDGIVISADDAEQSDFDDVCVSEDDTSMVIYTSGTSGVPKGIRHSRRMLSNIPYGFIENQKIEEDSVIGLYTYIGYALHASVLYPAIALGSTIDVIPEEYCKDVSKLDAYFRERSITHTAMTPSMVKAYLSFSDDVKLKSILMGGENVNIGSSRYDEILNVDYGSSETMSACTMRYCERKGRYDVGKPYRGFAVYVVDKEGRRLPPGAIGVLEISGCHVSPGYMKEMKDNPFHANRFSDDPTHSNVYNTGDAARLSFDGVVEILGRKDGMVKISGNRVETEDVESAILSLGTVKETVVIEGSEKGFPQTLIAYVVADGLTENDVKDAVGKTRPSYMVPAYVIFIDSIPHNVNGKIDKHALPKPEARPISEYSEPSNEHEEEVCEAFSKILGIEVVGIDDSFSSLGGDSLKAMLVQSAIGNKASSSDIMRLQTPRRIAEAFTVVEDYEIGAFSEGCALNDSQFGVYLDIASRGGGTQYNNPLLIRMADDVDVVRLEDAIRKTIESHPVLKARISVGKEIRFIFDCKPEIETASDETGFCRPFDETEGPLARFRICRESRLFCLDVHHLIFDGMSAGILLNDITKAYNGSDLDYDEGVLRQIAYETNNPSPISEVHSEIFTDIDTDAGLLPSVGKFEPSQKEIPVDVAREEILSVSKRFNVTEGSLLTSCFGYALSRFTGRNEAVFTTFTLGRGKVRLESAIGMFVRTVPMYIDCSDTEVFAFLEKSSSVIKKLMSSDTESFIKLSETFGFKLDVSFQYTGDIFDVDEGPFEEIIGLMQRDPVSPLNIDVTFRNGTMVAMTEHDSSYSDEFVMQIIGVFERILKAIISSDDTLRLSEIEYTSEEDLEREESVNGIHAELEFNDIVEAFRARVESHPDNVLVTYLDKSYTYSEVDAITDGVAYAISQRGIGVGDNVSILVHRSEWYLISALSVLKTGAAYVPIDDSLPDERIALMVEDSSSKAVLVTPETSHRIASAGINADVIDVTGCDPHGFDEIPIGRRDAAVILYTSGTTGIPKGAIIPHLAIISFAEWYRSYTKPTENDVDAMYVSYGFDVHIMHLYGPIVSGISLDVVPDCARFDIDKLNEHFISKGCTMTFLTTPVGKLFLTSVKDSSMRLMFIGGEKMGKADPVDYMVANNVCGPTESIVFVSLMPMRDRLVDNAVGWFISNVGGYVLDKERRRVPYGAVGELYLTGYQLSSGYLNRDELTAKAFMDNPFSEGRYGYERMYASGDFARFLPDGTIEIIGRRDGQLKIRGNRIELTEVDAAIKQMDDVKDVSVQAIINDFGAKELCAYVVLSHDGLTADSIRKFIAERKPPYMVPSHVVFLDRIPLNVNGKVDKKALPMPDLSSCAAVYVAPRNEMEKRLCASFEEVLELEMIGIDDDFIMLGGDSLKAIVVHRDCPFAISANILHYRTPRMIVEHSLENVVLRYGFDDECPLDDAQMAMLDTYGRNIDQAVVISSTYSFPEKYDYDSVRSMIEALISHHRALKARIVVSNGIMVMRFDKDHDLSLKECYPGSLFADLTGYEHSFDIGICRWDGRIHLVIRASHMVSDSFTESAIENDMNLLMAGEAIEDDMGILEQLTFESSHKDDDADVIHSKAMFESITDGCATRYLPRSDGGDYGVQRHPINVDSNAIDEYISKNDLTQSTFFSAVFATALNRMTNKDKCLFYVMQNGRMHLSSYSSIGLFAKCVPVALSVEGTDFIDNARMLSDLFNMTNIHDEYPVWKMLREKNLAWDVRFQFLPLIDTPIDGVEVSYEGTNLVVPDGVLWVAVYEEEDGYNIYISRAKDYSDEVVEMLIDAYNTVVSEVVSGKKS